MTGVVLRTEALSKSFPGVRALDQVSIAIREREVLGLVGENGAGKSTLLKILAGVSKYDSGLVYLRGSPVHYRGVSAARAHGIAMVFQEQSLLLNASVAENIMLGHEGGAARGGFYNWKRLNGLAEQQLNKLDIDISPAAITGDLSFGQRQLVELAKALAIEEHTKRAPIILLDEPTSVLEAEELETVLTQIERLKSRASIVFVSHRLDEVIRVSDRIYVMTNGECVAEREPDSCDVAELQRLMLGRDLEAAYARRTRCNAQNVPVRLRAEAISRRGKVSNISFQVGAGRILGLAGLEGSGREALSRMLCGAEPIDDGCLYVDGNAIRLRDCAEAVHAGIGYVPSERRAEGVISGMSVRENITLAHIGMVKLGPFIHPASEKTLARTWVERLQIKTPSIDTLVDSLSGGNQQKVVLSKWMIAQNLKILVLDHPMRGLDVGAKAEVFKLIKALAERGVAIVLIADTLEELLSLSDEIIVMRDGSVTASFVSTEGELPSRLQILESMV